ncbi:hypothetical protein SESBI_39967 [Sesbania bispinosa]|nr:hypothetical protein SESBI_39967 [Sesbania bispinosa]
MPATIKTHLSPADMICALRLSATNVADMNPATAAIIHLNISNGTTDIHCTNQKGLESTKENVKFHTFLKENLKSSNSPKPE